ncbi:MAG: acyl-CoA thioesterase [Actinobacteria bacterium]|nr:acyl-CoA thioesterase [Actinomycetota bacterium]
MPPFIQRNTFRVVMSEVDVAQIHFTAVHRWMDRGLSEWLAAVGHPFTALLADGVGVPIVETRCRFHARILLDDIVTLETAIGNIGRTSFRSFHAVRRDGELAAEGELTHVMIERAGRTPIPVPAWLREHSVADWDPVGERLS